MKKLPKIYPHINCDYLTFRNKFIVLKKRTLKLNKNRREV